MTHLFSSRRLRLAPLGPALAALVTVALLLWLLLPALLVRTVADQLLDEARVLAPGLMPALGPEVTPGSERGLALQARIQALPAGGPLRATVIALDGTVLADSARESERLAEMENHVGRPEVVAALREGTGYSVRRSATTDQHYVYAARAVTTAEGHRFIFRLAKPIEQLAQLRNRLATVTLLALAAALAAMMLVSLYLDRRLLQPLVGVIRSAGRLAAGDYDHRLPIPEDRQLATLADALNRLASRVGEQVGAVERERDHLYQILARMSEGVLVVGADGRTELVNPAFRALFAVERPVAGMTPLEITRLPDLAGVVDASLRGDDQGSLEVELDLPEHRTLLLASSSLGRNGGAVLVVRDTTAASRLAATRRDFVANVSHELRTPLAAIRGYAETLHDGALEEPEHARHFVRRILAHCSRLQALLDDLLTLSRLESSEKTPVERPVDLAAIATRAVETIANAAKKRQVTIEVELGELAPGSSAAEEAPTLLGDPDSLERLLLNLLENAVKYNREKGRVSLSIQPAGEAIEITVRDTGLGIPVEALPRLFERFYRVDKGRSRAEGGTGLGLAIVKHIAQLHGGTVEVESEEGVYSQFRVRLPRRPVATL